MYKILHEHKQKERCCTVFWDNNYNEYFAFSDGNVLKVYYKYDINNIGDGAEPAEEIVTSNDIVCAKMNCSGDMKSWKFDFHPKRNELATGNYCIDIFDIDSAEKIAVLQNDLKFIYSMLYLDSQTLAVGNTNGSINIFSLETLKTIHKAEEHCLPVRALAADTENKKLISCSDDLHINIMDSNIFKVNLSLVGHKDFITAVSVNNKHNVYASCSHDGSIKIWDIKQSKCVQTIHLPNLSVNEEGNNLWDVSFSPDGTTLLCGSDYGFHVLTLS